MAVNLRSLIGKLNDTTRNAIESAAGLCVTRTHYDVEIEHYLLKLLDAQGTDLPILLRHFGVDRSRFSVELTRSLDQLKSGNARTPALSPTLVRMCTEAWAIGSIDFGAEKVRSGHTVLALLANDELVRLMRDVSKEFQKIKLDELRLKFLDILGASVEISTGDEPTPASGADDKRIVSGKSPNLDQYTVDLTANARNGKLDTVLGRDFEIRQVIDILTRRRQNNPILVGEAGVGKTAIAEGFAMRVARGDVPPPLRNVTVRTLDLALLQAGAGVRGEFENRLKGLINEVKSSPVPIILFIDEAHTMIGAGGAAGQGDAANLLKPALARGELRSIAATTWSEYKRYFEKDPALARRFQLVKVEEPDEAQCAVMLRGLVPILEEHHKVRILDEGLQSAVKLSHRFLPDRQLPDKAVSVLDTACARLALGHSAIPATIEDATRLLDDLVVQSRVLEREAATGADHAERLAQIAENRLREQTTLNSLNARWEKEKELVGHIRELRALLESGGQTGTPPANGASEGTAKDPTLVRAELDEHNKELAQLQGEKPLMRVCVDAQIVADVVSGWTGIPVGKMLKDEVETVMNLEAHLASRVIGQDHALEAVSQRLRTARAGLDDPGKPVGVFLLVGPSGVGKTETALAISDLLFGGERNVITINMSEFQEAHTISTLKGSPPGYVGYGEGGVLTEAVRRRPYSVVLLDEVEKAHPDVLELFFQVFDKGTMEDGEGRKIDFKNTILILTSNAGTDTIMKFCAECDREIEIEELVQVMKPGLNRIFKPAFLGRLVIIPYFPIGDDALRKIVVLKLNKIQRRIQESHHIGLQYDQSLIDAVAARSTEVESGARNIDNILTNSLLPDVSRLILGRMADRQRLQSIRVTVDGGGEFVYSTTDTPER
jgi:type VI secretion system protein VasG